MCIRDSGNTALCSADGECNQREPRAILSAVDEHAGHRQYPCLLYTSDAADERSSVDLGGRRIIKKKNNNTKLHTSYNTQRKQKQHTLQESKEKTK